jgi:putative transposase
MRTRFYSFERPPFHVVFKSAMDIPLSDVWPQLLHFLQGLLIERRLTTHAFVLMRNHFHLLCSGEGEIVAVIEELSDRILPWFPLDVVRSAKRIFPIVEFYQYRQVYKYIYRNPVEAGIVRRVQDYRYSTIRYLTGANSELFLMEDPFGFICDPIRMLDWLNTADHFV